MTRDIELDPPKRRRVTDHSNQEARRAVGSAVSEFGLWRRQLAQMSVMSGRHPSDDEQAMMVVSCGSIRRLLNTAREEFEFQVGQLSSRAATNGRIADARLAMDNIEATIDKVVDQLFSLS